MSADDGSGVLTLALTAGGLDDISLASVNISVLLSILLFRAGQVND